MTETTKYASAPWLARNWTYTNTSTFPEFDGLNRVKRYEEPESTILVSRT